MIWFRKYAVYHLPSSDIEIPWELFPKCICERLYVLLLERLTKFRVVIQEANMGCADIVRLDDSL
jgi:hypothetical protein